VLPLISTVASRAQSFPSHPIKIVVPYPAGGPADTIARVATQSLGAELGVGVFIENVSGSAGRLGTKNVIHSAPDGYTLLLGGCQPCNCGLSYAEQPSNSPLRLTVAERNASRR
jgi:tripartite-type tricarboxylate transporter receptor subunit TctC